MLTADRRIHEGSRALALAFNIGRAQEALLRLREGTPLSDAEMTYFLALQDLFLDALEGWKWVSAVSRGEARSLGSSTLGQLDAFRLALGALAEKEVAELERRLRECVEVAKAVAGGQSTAGDALTRFNLVLDQLAKLAVGHGKAAIESTAPAITLTALP